MKTVLHGHFEKGIMKEARATKIIAERCNRGVKEIKVAEPAEVDGPVYKFHQINAIRINDQPTLMDPYERKTLYIKDSPMAIGEGAFAKRDIKAGEVVSYYSGTLHDKDVFWDNQTQTEQLSKQLKCSYSFSKSAAPLKLIFKLTQCCSVRADIQKNLIHYSLDDGESSVNVKKPFWSLAKYRATLGHKVNHSFEPNTYYHHGYHARFGYVTLICASRDIKRGEELLADYQYDGDDENEDDESVPQWFADLYEEQTGKEWPTPTF